MSERIGEDVARNAEARHDEPANATVLPEHLRTKRPVLPPGTEPTTAHLQEALDACTQLSMSHAAVSVELARVTKERDGLHAENAKLRSRLDTAEAELAKARMTLRAVAADITEPTEGATT